MAQTACNKGWWRERDRERESKIKGEGKSGSQDIKGGCSRPTILSLSL